MCSCMFLWHSFLLYSLLAGYTSYGLRSLCCNPHFLHLAVCMGCQLCRLALWISRRCSHFIWFFSRFLLLISPSLSMMFLLRRWRTQMLFFCSPFISRSDISIQIRLAAVLINGPPCILHFHSYLALVL